jgi:hypothetical protein
VSVVRTECRGFRLCFCVNLIFVSESSARGEDGVQGIKIMFVCDCDIYL